MRQQEVTRSGVDGTSASSGGTTLRSQAKGFQRFVNGDKSRSRPMHYCDVCCSNEHGETTRAQQVDNFIAALIGIGLFGGRSWIAAPSKSRWLSSFLTLSIIVAGVLVHGLLKKVWQVAFPDWHLERIPDQDDKYHKMVRSKCYRAKLYLSGDHTAWRGTCISLSAQPVDHLMQRSQALDEAGSALLDFKGWSSAVASCQRRLFSYCHQHAGGRGVAVAVGIFQQHGP